MLVLDHAITNTVTPQIHLVFIEYRKLKTWLHSSLVDSWLKYVNCYFVLFNGSKERKQAIIWEWAFQFSDQYKQSCNCTPLLFPGLSGRSEPKKWAFLVQNMKLFLSQGWMRGVVHMTLWSGVADYVIFLTTFTWHNHPLMIHTARNSDQNDIPEP